MKSRYRRFKIKSVDAVGDTQRIAEVFSRRLSRIAEKGWELPDLFIIDGGQNQLNSALNILRSMTSVTVSVVSLAKVRNQRCSESLFLSNGTEICLDSTSPVTLFFDRIRDEAHRFAITYHRRVRDRNVLNSQIQAETRIPKRVINRLMRQLGAVEKIVEATDVDLMKVEGVGSENDRKNPTIRTKKSLPANREAKDQ